MLFGHSMIFPLDFLSRSGYIAISGEFSNKIVKPEMTRYTFRFLSCAVVLFILVVVVIWHHMRLQESVIINKNMPSGVSILSDALSLEARSIIIERLHALVDGCTCLKYYEKWLENARAEWLENASVDRYACQNIAKWLEKNNLSVDRWAYLIHVEKWLEKNDLYNSLNLRLGNVEAEMRELNLRREILAGEQKQVYVDALLDSWFRELSQTAERLKNLLVDRDGRLNTRIRIADGFVSINRGPSSVASRGTEFGYDLISAWTERIHREQNALEIASRNNVLEYIPRIETFPSLQALLYVHARVQDMQEQDDKLIFIKEILKEVSGGMPQ